MSAALIMPEPHAAGIQSLAAQLAETMVEASSAQSALADAEGRRDNIAERISAFAAERDAIVVRRRSGTQESDDGARLALISADVDGLNGMLPDAVANVAQAKSAFDVAAAACAGLRSDIAQAEAMAAHDALIPHAGILAEKLLVTINAIAETGHRAGIGGRPPWSPRLELFYALRKLLVERREL